MITFDGVSFTYPETDLLAIDDLSFQVTSGVTLLVGPLGAGTSTVLLAAAGLAPTETGGELDGAVNVLGRDPASSDGRRLLHGKIGYVQPSPWTQLTGMMVSVEDEVMFGASQLGWERDRMLEAGRRALEAVGATHLAKRDPRTLSGGELQRITLAAALVTGPEVLLLDNPTSELDVEGADQFFGRLGELADSVTVLMATTDLDRAAEIASRVLLMDRGKIIGDGDPGVLASTAALERNCVTTPAFMGARLSSLHPVPVTVDQLMETLAAQ